ncbi:MAG TPA: metal ABC transporter substrate-binding protein [Trueperaceae bacterium]
MLVRLLITALYLLLSANALGQVRVVASIAPYGDLAHQVGGEAVEVSVMLPAGASPHTFEPSPRDAARISGADLVVLNGASDEWLREIAASVNPDARVVEALEVLEDELLVGGEPEDSHGRGVNPHVWLDPLLMREVALALGTSLAELDPARADAYTQRASSVASSLTALDAELREILAPVRGAPFIPFHDAWPYFARRYGLDLVMEIEPFPGREPSPRYLASVVRAIRESGAPAIFNEAGLSGRAAQVLAQEAAVEVATLDPLGAGGESYAEMMRRNARTVAESLEKWEPR